MLGGTLHRIYSSHSQHRDVGIYPTLPKSSSECHVFLSVSAFHLSPSNVSNDSMLGILSLKLLPDASKPSSECSYKCCPLIRLQELSECL